MIPVLAPAPTLLWPHQTRYHTAAQSLARDLFDALDDDLQPQVVVMALPVETDLPARCLEPGDCGLPADAFANVVARGRIIQLTTPSPYAERSDVTPAMIRRKHEGMGIRDAVQEILDALDENALHQHFSGWPVEIKGYFVVTILRLQRKPLRAYPSLRPYRFYTDGRPLAPSLLVAAMYRFNEEIFKALNDAEPGAGLFVRPRESEELLRSAGKSLLDTPAQALGLDPAAATLFATCNTISSLRYEGAEGVGKLLLARRGHPNIEEIFALTCPTDLTDYRAVRKLLEMTTPDVHLLADGENVYALGRLTGKYDAEREDLFVINFVTHYAWELQHDGHVLLRSHYGLPGLPRTRLNRTGFRKALKRTFALTDHAKIERLWDVVLEASRQKHGTLLVITTEALAEADRLKLQCTLIEPVPLTPLITRLVTSIDGAVLLDPEGYCYSIGVILDGRASGRGDSTRGARYNSALRYVESSDYPCLAVVVSEDGLVDIITSEQE
ncbi:DNA integrity scanning protein DisA nucleotide-binding domain protein [Hymenobacter sp. BT523]|uniref:DNA integrity scanning protein DisA nucleotide-binding domain protein n=1 Tax=Hymenobacter sp. BT523 TaxID=2795725 RepID=UPI0018EAA9C3|nr:diadenylate cyclase [Hymenobacter sp. BT523]MBJ6108621.1 DNA integrity scanning protein DisA nucleotide-binding domain protein [Hymenobacter sp. BT523]